MKKDVITIVALLFLILLLGGGIFFAVKTNMFSTKTDEKTNLTRNEQYYDEYEDEDKEESQQEELEKPEEKVEEVEPPKKEEPKKEEKPVIKPPVINKVEVIEKNPTLGSGSGQNQENNNKNNNQNNDDQNKKDDNNGDNPENKDDSQNDEPKPPVLPKGGTLTCTQITNDEEGVLTHTIVGVFDTTDGYINNYKETFVYDFTETYEPFDDEIRALFEKALNDEVVASLGEHANSFTITPGSRGNIINVSLASDRNRLKVVNPDGFTTNGNFYYENFKSIYVNLGYTCG